MNNRIFQLVLLTGVMAINYILYCTKDTLIVHHMGPDAVVFIRTYLVIPFIFLFFFTSNKLTAVFGMRAFFSGLVTLFAVFQLVFSFVVYPRLEAFGSTYWPLILFYLVSEIWVVFVLGVITWQAINSVNTVDSAKKTYHPLQLFSNLIIFLTSQLILLINISKDWTFSLQLKSLIMLLLSGMLIYAFYNLVPADAEIKRKQKVKHSIVKFLKTLVSNKPAFSLFLMVLFYSFCNTFSETMNRYYIKNYSATIIDYNNVMAYQSACISVLTIAFILLGGFFIRFNLQRLSLVITPFFVFGSAIVFFLCSGAAWIVLPLSVLQISVIKASKYGLIDPIKEMCYLKMDEEMKGYGKSFIDGLSNRSGKTIGNFLQQILILGMGGIGLSLPLFLGILAAVSLCWIFNTKSLLKEEVVNT